MDETFLLVLIETIDCVYVDALRDFISQHLISGFHLQVSNRVIFPRCAPFTKF